MEKIWRVLDILEWSANFLAEKEIEPARLTAEILLAHVLKCKRIDLYLRFDQPVQPAERGQFRKLLVSRANGMPVQYLTGDVEFYSLPFKVTSDVLIPRPETEILVETVLDLFDREQSLRIWDIGTGSGVIAVVLATHLPAAHIIASDVSPAVLKIATENARLNGVHDRIEFKHSNMADAIPAAQFDLIVSNPPYIARSDMSQLPREVKHEPALALDGGEMGLTYYRHIAKLSPDFLKPQGYLALEIGYDQADVVTQILEATHIFNEIKCFQDYAGHDRVILACRNGGIQ